MFSTVSVSFFVRQQDYAKSFQAIIIKPCRILDYTEKTIKFRVDKPTIQRGRLAASLDF